MCHEANKLLGHKSKCHFLNTYAGPEQEPRKKMEQVIVVLVAARQPFVSEQDTNLHVLMFLNAV